MNMTKPRIIIKGNKEGLQFLMDPSCSYEELVEELKQKLRSSHAQLFQGPLTHVHLYFGPRYISSEQKKEITELIEESGNLLVKGVHSDVMTRAEAEAWIRASTIRIEVGTVRSGQMIESRQDILLIGDINPGGWVVSAGNIFVLGTIRGYAHAGKEGALDKVICASRMEPTHQLRIGNLIYQPEDEGFVPARTMEFAYIEEDQFHFADLQYLKQIRPRISESILFRD